MNWREKEKQASPPPTTPTHAAKPSLNDRLALLAKGAQSPSTDSSQDGSKEDEKERGRGRKPPTRSQTQPPEATLFPSKATASPSPSPSPAPPRKPNGRSMSSPNATFEDVKQHDGKAAPDAPPIVPTPIRTRTPPPAFAVTSRPTSQFSMLSIGALNQQEPQWHADSRASEETVRTSRARASTLIADGEQARSKGFTGGGLLAAAAAGSISSLSGQSTGSGAVPTRAGRQRASTIISSSPAPAPSISPSPSPLGSSVDARSRSRSNVRRNSQLDTPPHDLPPPRLVTRTTSPDTRNVGSSASSPTMRPLKSALKPSPQPSPVSETNAPFPRSRTSSLAAFSSFPTPPRPFAESSSGFGLRGNSPASSTGDSSSGRTPITPVDGSDLSATAPSAMSAQRRTHRKSASVTFDEPERGRPGVRGDVDNAEGSGPDERRRRERRRSEAKAAIEVRVRVALFALSPGANANVSLSSVRSSTARARSRLMTTTRAPAWTTWARA